MNKYLRRAQRYHESIKNILLNDWDPVGVQGIPEASDEYDSYVSGIYHLLIHHATEDRIFDHLWKIETEYMELIGNQIVTRKVSKKLVSFRGRIENES